jgi:phosphoserine phosphatase RsbU/P
MMTARLAGYLSGTSPDQNIALVLTDFGIYDAHSPAELASQLNRIVLEEMQTDSYFTLAYADVDLVSGRVSLVQAGHPHPAVLRADGTVIFLGDGGLPIGMFDGAVYEGFDVQLLPGDRLFLMSDGMTEAAGRDGRLLGEDGLAGMMRRHADLKGQTFLEALIWDLSVYTDDEFADDVSGAFFEFRGAKENVG